MNTLLLQLLQWLQNLFIPKPFLTTKAVIISDLSYLEVDNEINGITGGLDIPSGIFVNVNATTSASYGLGLASANAFAIGPQTFTFTQTTVSTYVSGSIAMTNAHASASAYASNGNFNYYSKVDSFSLFISSQPSSGIISN